MADETFERIEELGRPRRVESGPIERIREHIAGWITGVLLAAFAVTLLSPLAYWLTRGGSPPPEMIEYVKTALSPLTTLLGTTVGFYFSQRRLPPG